MLNVELILSNYIYMTEQRNLENKIETKRQILASSSREEDEVFWKC